jgi:hypothetical protein
MHKYYTYQWHLLHLNTKCNKCGNNIPFQNNETFPTCNECGHANKISWTNIIKTADVEGMKRGGSFKKTMLGTIDATLSFELVEQIPCLHCKAPLTITQDTPLQDYSCESCHKKVEFSEYAEIEDLIFYKNGGEQLQEGIKMIAVRCVSCGAPLEADPTKSAFNCKFCATDNILPMSLRYKVVLDDIYFGEKKKRYPKLLAFEKDGQIVKQSLRENGKASFADAELDQVLLNKKNDAGIYHMIVQEFNYLPSDKILNEIFFNSTNATIIKQAGTRLQKSQEDIASRISLISPKTPEKKIVTNSSASSQVKKRIDPWPLIMIILVIIIVIVALILRNR